MADIILKYLTDLPSASDAESTDLMHINQAGNDRSITLDILASALFNIRYPVGKVEWFANNANPNAIWAGSTWARVPGEGKTIRIAKADGVDLLQQGGSDSLQLQKDNIPAHDHLVNIDTDSYDYGTKETSANGDHNHEIPEGEPLGNNVKLYTSGDDWTSQAGNWSKSRNSGSHKHTTAIGAHSHTVNGSTGSTGEGKAINITNAYVKLAAWYRIS